MIGYNTYQEIADLMPDYRPGIETVETVFIHDALCGRFGVIAKVYLAHHDDAPSTYEGFKEIVSVTSTMDGKKYTGRIAKRIEDAIISELDSWIGEEFSYGIIY